MKRLMAFLMAALCLLSAAQAETFTLHKGEDEVQWLSSNLYWEAETFSGGVPEVLLEAWAASPYAADEVLSGVWLREYYFRLEGKENVLNDQAMLIAMRHEGRNVLLGAARLSGKWMVRLQSETFLRDGEDFVLTALPDDLTRANHACLAVQYGKEAYLISFSSPDEPWQLNQYQRIREDGGLELLQMHYSGASWIVRANGERVTQDNAYCLLPACLEALDADEVPASLQSLRAWEAAHPLTLGENEGYMGGANLRQKATGSSRSLGVYTAGARVTLLGQAAGRDFPWYNVRVGEAVGWVSGAYFYTEELDRTNLYHFANEMQPAARVKKMTSLLREPGGEALASLPAETEVHVLAQSGSWAHVIVPRGELTWQTDWDGDYGYVPVSALTVAASPLQLRQTED